MIDLDRLYKLIGEPWLCDEVRGHIEERELSLQEIEDALPECSISGCKATSTVRGTIGLYCDDHAPGGTPVKVPFELSWAPWVRKRKGNKA